MLTACKFSACILTHVVFGEDTCNGGRNNSKIDSSELENRIDQMVYKLYDLKPEEIAIIESSIH